MKKIDNRITFLLICLTFLHSCVVSVPCDDGDIKLGFISFSHTATKSMVIRQFKKASNFTCLIDTILITSDSSSYKALNDTVIIEYSFDLKQGYTDSKNGLSCVYDYEIYLPRTKRIFQISNIIEEFKMRKHGLITADPECKILFKSYTVNGQMFQIDTRDLTIYLKN